MKSGELVVVVESVREAVKFYTEKLGFDLVALDTNEDRGDFSMVAAQLRKGKCVIHFRMHQVDEITEFSVVKRCMSRCVSVQVEMKKGIERYFERCNKKHVQFGSELKETADKRMKSFTVKDPFGVKLLFIQPNPAVRQPVASNFLGLPLKREVLTQAALQASFMEEMTAKLKKIGVLRRASKKYARLWIKQQQRA